MSDLLKNLAKVLLFSLIAALLVSAVDTLPGGLINSLLPDELMTGTTKGAPKDGSDPPSLKKPVRYRSASMTDDERKAAKSAAAQEETVELDDENLTTVNIIPKRTDANRTIFGADNRKVVKDTGVYPYGSVAYIISSCPYGESYEGTGYLVGPKTLITAAHVLYCDKHGCVCAMDFYFGRKKNGKSDYHYSGPATYWYSANYNDIIHSYDDDCWDYAYIRLDKAKMGNKVGTLALRAGSDSDLVNDGICDVIGYRRSVMKQGKGPLKSVESHRLSFKADLQPGNSGGPILTSDGRYVVGIAAAETDDMNYACRIRVSMVDTMANMGLITLDCDPDNPDIPPEARTRHKKVRGQVFAESGTRYLTDREVNSVGSGEVGYAINEIYARRGLRFTNKDKLAYYRKFKWYKPTISRKKWNKGGDKAMLNEHEYANVLNLNRRKARLAESQ